MCTPTGWINMVDMEVTVFDNGETTVRQFSGEEEQRRYVAEQFKMRLPQWEA